MGTPSCEFQGVTALVTDKQAVVKRNIDKKKN